jgi:hypothetical protein
MRNKLYFPLLFLFFCACSKNNNPPPVAPKEPVIKETAEPLYFKVIPVAGNQVKISFLYPGERQLEKLLLKKDTSTIGVFSVQSDNNSLFSTVIQYPFSDADKYNFIVQSNALNDTVYQYAIRDYAHVFVNAYDYRKLLTIRHNPGYNAYDISPSRNVIFVTEADGTDILLKKLTLSNLKVETVSDNAGLLVRAISDDEILMKTMYYDKRYLGGDSAALLKYNITSRESAFIDWVSESYSRTSRVVDDHIFVTRPVFAAASSTLINLADQSKITYPANTIDFAGIREHNFDHIYYQNKMVDINTGNLVSTLPISDSALLEYTDDATGYSIVTQYTNSTNKRYDSRLSVYQANSKIYESDYVGGRVLQIGKILNIENNRILFHQYYDYDTTFRTDGYYVLDLDAKEVSLVQCDSIISVINDFQLDRRTIISVRPDGVYRLVLK